MLCIQSYNCSSDIIFQKNVLMNNTAILLNFKTLDFRHLKLHWPTYISEVIITGPDNRFIL